MAAVYSEKLEEAKGRVSEELEILILLRVLQSQGQVMTCWYVSGRCSAHQRQRGEAEGSMREY